MRDLQENIVPAEKQNETNSIHNFLLTKSVKNMVLKPKLTAVTL